MSVEFVAKLIRQTVDANTSLESTASSIQVRALTNYFSNPKYIDTAYSSIIDRVETSTKNTAQILAKCLRLLKSNLMKYYPSDETLLHLDRFAHRMQQQFSDSFKTLAFVRALLDAISKSRHIRKREKEREKDRDSKSRTRPGPIPIVTLGAASAATPVKDSAGPSATPATPRSSSPSRPRSESSRPGALTKRTKDPPHSSKLVVRRVNLHEHKRGNLISNYLLSRCLRSKSFSQINQTRQDIEIGSPLQSISLFACQLETKPPGSKQDSSDILVISDGDLVKERIVAVGMSKKNEERQMYRSFRRAAPLFQYKHYREQSRLNLPPKQMEEIVNAMLSAKHDTRMVASKIFIKLILDAYCQDESRVATSVLLSLVQELLECELIDVKLHALNLLFNVSVHINMLEEIPFFNQTQDLGTTSSIFKIQQDLYGIVKEALLMLALKKETNRKLWFAGMNILFFFATDRGSVDKEKLVGLDYRVIVGFFKYVDYLSDSVWRMLVRTLINRLYLEKNVLDMEAFTSGMLDIAFIVDLFVTSRSMEARENLFVIIFDYLLYCYIRRRRRAISRDSDSEDDDLEDEESKIKRNFNNSIQLLKMTDAPHFFVNLFKFPMAHFSSMVLSALTTKSPSTTVLLPFTSKVDLSEAGIFGHVILADIYKLAVHYYQLDAVKKQVDEITKFVNLHNPTKQKQPLPSLYYTPPSERKADAPKDRRHIVLTKNDSIASRASSSNASSEDSEAGSVVINLNDDVATDDLDQTIAPTASKATDEELADDEAWEDDNVDVAKRFASHFVLLAQLLASTSDQERRVGEQWLFKMKQSILETLLTPNDSPLEVESNHPLVQLDTELERVVSEVILKSTAFPIRKIFLNVIEKLVLFIKTQAPVLTEEKAMRDASKMLNDALGRLMSLGERSEPMLMAMFDLIFSFVAFPQASVYEPYADNEAISATPAMPLGGSRGSGELPSSLPSNPMGTLNSMPAGPMGTLNSLPPWPHHAHSIPAAQQFSAGASEFDMNSDLDDSRAALFIQGRGKVSMRQLRRVNIMILHHIFIYLPPRYTCQMRSALLYLMIERCKENKQDLDSIGGNGFFKKLLIENDPQISFLASRFLIDMLQKEKPEHFMDVVNTLLVKAIEADDPKLVSNPYLQVKAILEMTNTLSPPTRNQ